MRKIRKHHFSHKDPEQIETQNVHKADGSKLKHVQQKIDNLSFIKRDLKRTVIVISAFVILLIIIYIIQSKTALFNPILRLFGLK